MDLSYPCERRNANGISLDLFYSFPGGGRPRASHRSLVPQIALAIVFALAGWMKVSTPAADLAKMAPGFPLALLRFIGIAELAGSIGIILPALTRIAPVLTPLASSGFVIVMASAAVLHLVRGELGELAVVAVLGTLSAFVAWGRFKRAPIAPRERHGATGLHLDEGRQS